MLNMKNITVDIILPVYNEAHVMEDKVRTLRRYLKRNFPYQWKITIVDNASVDQTLQKAKKLSQQYEGVHYLHLKQKGRGRALRAAWSASTAEIVCYMDIDLSTHLGAFPALIELLVNGNDIAIGSRLKKEAKVKRCLRREILSRGYNILLKTIFSTHFSDAQCGFKALTKRIVGEVIPQVENQEWFFDTELLVLAEKQGYNVAEVPVQWTEDPDSRVHILKTIAEDRRGVLRLSYYLYKGSLIAYLKEWQTIFLAHLQKPKEEKATTP
jgi:glycosyltransferase involved in cell wall biosynthesis